MDELYERIVVLPLYGLARFCSGLDVGQVDGLYFAGPPSSYAHLGSLVRPLRNGLVHELCALVPGRRRAGALHDGLSG